VVEDLKTKKAWFEANQTRVTSENVSKAESDIERLTNTVKDVKLTDVSPNIPEEYPREPSPTPQDVDAASAEAPTSATLEKVDAVLEQEATAVGEES